MSPNQSDTMIEPFPWMVALDAVDRATCAIDLLRSARGSSAANEERPAVAEILAWRETATAIAAGLSRTDVDWIDNEAVSRP